MNRIEAATLVQELRRRSKWHGSDLVVAQRAEGVYRKVAVVFCAGAILEAVIAAAFGQQVFYLTAIPFLMGALICYWRSRRFTQILSLLMESSAKADTTGMDV
jgi:hypothetical protein